MSFGAGRPAKRPDITAVRELSKEEIGNLKRNPAPSVKRFRDSHHMVARLFAMGLRPGEVAYRSGYSLGRISTLSADPAFQDLVSKYRDDEDASCRESRDEFYSLIAANGVMAARITNDKLGSVDLDDISFRELILIQADSADRTGYGKRNTQVNVNVDFAASLDKAIQRSSQANGEARQLGPVGTSEHLHAGPPTLELKANPPQTIRRRI